MSASYDLGRLRAAFAQPAASPQPQSCPSLSEIWEGVHDELPADRLRDVIDHLAACSACAEAWRVALILERPPASETAETADTAAEIAAETGAGPLDEKRLAPRPPAKRQRERLPSRQRWLYPALGAVAAAVLAVVLSVYPAAHHGETPAVSAQLRGAAGPLQAPPWRTARDAGLARGNARLEWSGPQGATYNIAVEMDDPTGAAKPLLIAAAKGLSVTAYTVPPARLEGVPAGTRLRATLDVHLADGRSEIDILPFHLR